jgi:hypothetical protein
VSRVGVSARSNLELIRNGKMKPSDFEQYRGMFLAETEPIVEFRKWLEGAERHQ